MGIGKLLRTFFEGNDDCIAPIIENPYDRGFDKDFRLPDDQKNVKRINQRAPAGLPKKIEEFIPVVGISREDTKRNAEDFIKGSYRKIELKKEPNNQFDKNAILVIGHFKQKGDEFSLKLGYLPAETAKEISDKYSDTPIKATLKVMYTPIGRKCPGIRLDIWGPRAKKLTVTEKSYNSSIKVPGDKVERNLEGYNLEKKGLINNAIEFYQANVKEDFEGSYPYERLAIIYRKHKQYDNEIVILEKVIRLFENKVSKARNDRIEKIEKFKTRLIKVMNLKNNT